MWTYYSAKNIALSKDTTHTLEIGFPISFTTVPNLCFASNNQLDVYIGNHLLSSTIIMWVPRITGTATTFFISLFAIGY